MNPSTVRKFGIIKVSLVLWLLIFLPRQSFESSLYEVSRFMFCVIDKLLIIAGVNRESLAKLLEESQGFGHKLGLIIDECTISKKEELIEMGDHISSLFPYFDLVCLNVPVGGQIPCIQGQFNVTRTMGFQRYVLTVGYRSSNTLLLFNSRALHANTGYDLFSIPN